MTGNQPEVVARRRVVAGVHGSPNSLLALRRAVYAARLCGACVELVYVMPSDASPATQMTRFALLGMAVRCEFPDGPGVPFGCMVDAATPPKP